MPLGPYADVTEAAEALLADVKDSALSSCIYVGGSSSAALVSLADVVGGGA